MNSFLDHIILNVSDPKVSLPFYKDFFKYLGYSIIRDDAEHITARKSGTPDFWIVTTEEKYASNAFHRKNTGINHFAFHVSSPNEVDKFSEEFLKPRGITTLYDSPKKFPEYTPDYYAVFFEDPDRIKLEVCFIAPDRGVAPTT